MIDLSIEEREIYDRQIRIWGMEAQSRLRQAKVLVVNFDGFTSEISKNCVLSGMSLDIMDNRQLDTEDHGNFYLKAEDVGLTRGEAGSIRIQEINKLVKVRTVTELENEYKALITSGDISNCLLYNSLCRAKRIQSYYVFSSKESVLIIADLLNITPKTCFSLQEIIDKIPMFLLTPKRRPNLRFYGFLSVLYCRAHKIPVSESPNSIIDINLLRPLIEIINANFNQEFYPSISIAAGMVTQDLVKLITTGTSTFQLFFFDASNSVGHYETIQELSEPKQVDESLVENEINVLD